MLNGTDIFERTDFIIISCHSSDESHNKKIYINNILGKEINFGSQDVKDFYTISDVPLLITGCYLGRSVVARKYLTAGIKTYIGCSGEIPVASVILYITIFFYELVINRKNISTAHQVAQSQNKYTKLFKFYIKN